MSRTAMSTEAKATMRTNLVLEVNARKDKLLAMCEAQSASLRSRLERRVNRVPSNKRSITLIEVLEPAAAPQKAPPARKAKDAPPAPVPAPAPAPAPALSTRRTRPAAAGPAPAPAPVPKAAPKPTSKPAPKVASKPSRGVKRNSDDISTDDKENNAELTVPKKRAKAAPAPRATRNTRAASRKGDPAPQVLSPKTNNARPAPQTRTRRQR